VNLSWTFLWTRWELAALDWQAIATFAAVFAAWRVGVRQTKILEGQKALKEMEIRVSLLDRRLTVIGILMTDIAVLPFSPGLPVDSTKLTDALNLAEAIFDAPVPGEARSLCQDILEFAERSRMANNEPDIEQRARQQAHLPPERIELVERLRTLLNGMKAQTRLPTTIR